MKTAKSTLLLPLLLIALALGTMTGCSRSGTAAHGAAATRSEAPEPVAAGAGSPGQAGAGPLAAPLATAARALVVTMDVGVAVDDVDVADRAVREATARAGGYVAEATASGSGDERSVRLELRIPKDKAAPVHTGLGALGEVTSDVQKVEDVTEQHADLEARLANARVEEKRILEIMSQKAGSIGDLLAAEKELARVRETVERYEAQKRTLDGRVDLATIHVSLATRPVPAWQTPKTSIARAASEGLRGAVALAVYGAMALVASAPILLPPLAVIAAALALLRNRRRNRPAVAG